jgi:hypothetical protein
MKNHMRWIQNPYHTIPCNRSEIPKFIIPQKNIQNSVPASHFLCRPYSVFLHDTITLFIFPGPQTKKFHFVKATNLYSKKHQ